MLPHLHGPYYSVVLYWVILCTVYMWLSLWKQCMWAHEIWLHFQTFMTHIILWWLVMVINHFQHLLNIWLAKKHKLQNANILFHYCVMICIVIGHSLCPHALFSQAWSHIWYRYSLILLLLLLSLGFTVSSTEGLSATCAAAFGLS